MPNLNPTPQIRLYQNWLADQRGLTFDSYDALWNWSVTDLNSFWQSIWDYFDVQSPTPHTAALGKATMPGAEWFKGAQLNYAAQVLRHVDAAHAAGLEAIVAEDELGRVQRISWPELRRQVASFAITLQELGVQPGDRVAAYLPNGVEAIVACLGSISIGAIWSICAPDMGTPAVLDRFSQITPKVLVAADGVHYGGKALNRSATVQALKDALPTVEHLIVVRTAFATTKIATSLDFTWAVGREDQKTVDFKPLSLPFDHPIWIVYSSGTTGMPKPIVHGHGGIVMTLLTLKSLHNDIGCSYAANTFGERFHWYSSTGWVMWNAQMGGLATGTTICIYDGNPAGHALGADGKLVPDWSTLWRFAARHGVTWFGAGAAFFTNCMKAGLSLPALRIEGADCSGIRELGSTGSPLPEDVQRWGTAQFANLRAAMFAEADTSAAGPSQGATAPSGGSGPRAAGERGGDLSAAGPSQGATAPSGGSGPRAAGERGGDLSAAGPSQGATAPSGGSGPRAAGERGGDIWWCNISGGTDFCGAFIGGNRELPQVPGQMQCRALGCAVYAWNEAGEAVTDAVGELVCTEPIPSMPLYFWNDANNARYIGSYFDMYPGVWRHGDWLKVGADGGCVIYGRSDATINRQGLRMGTSEIYAAVEALPEVLDSMVIDLEYLGRDSDMPLFVVLRDGFELTDALKAKINTAIRERLSPRFVPNSIHAAPAIPRTLSGKKQELPIKKRLLGQPLSKVVNRDAMANPECLDWYEAFAQSRN